MQDRNCKTADPYAVDWLCFFSKECLSITPCPEVNIASLENDEECLSYISCNPKEMIIVHW